MDSKINLDAEFHDAYAQAFSFGDVYTLWNLRKKLQRLGPQRVRNHYKHVLAIDSFLEEIDLRLGGES